MPASLEPFSGVETFTAPPAQVFAALTDLDALPAAMPGLVSSERVDDRTLKAVVRPGLTFMAGQIRLTLTLEERRPPAFAVMRVVAASIGVAMNIDTKLDLSPIGEEGQSTRLNWEARVHDMRGLITAVPGGLIRAAADKVITDGWKAMRSRIEGPPVT
jgi:carbon monoxide dehydrogenase subunit G